MWTLTGVGLGGAGDMLLFRALFLLVPVELVCEPCVSCSWKSTISHSEGDRLVDRMFSLSFLEAPLAVDA